MPGQGARDWEFRLRRGEGVQSLEHSECPVGEREEGIWGWGVPCYPFPEARLQRDHAAAAAVPLAVGGLSLSLLS